MSRGRSENLRPWKKGQSGNPGGRPKHDRSADIAAAVFAENSDAIYQAMRKKLLKGDARVFAVLAERAFGKATHKTLTPQTSGALPVRVKHVNVAEIAEP